MLHPALVLESREDDRLGHRLTVVPDRLVLTFYEKSARLVEIEPDRAMPFRLNLDAAGRMTVHGGVRNSNDLQRLVAERQQPVEVLSPFFLLHLLQALRRYGLYQPVDLGPPVRAVDADRLCDFLALKCQAQRALVAIRHPPNVVKCDGDRRPTGRHLALPFHPDSCRF